MNVDLIRAIDKFIGIPVCIILSIVNKFSTKKKKKNPVKKILFLQISEMGSAISAYSALVKTKKLYPEAEIYYFIFKEMQASVKLLDIIPEENLYSVTSKSLTGFVFGILKMIFVMRRKKIDVILDLELFSRLSSILSYLFGAGIRCGFYSFHMEGLYRGTLQTHKVIYNHLIHISQNFLSLVYSIKENPEDSPLSKIPIDRNDEVIPKINSSDEEKNNIWKKLQKINPDIDASKKIIILNPNASELLPLRKWAIGNYINLAKKILHDPLSFVIITGVVSEKKDAITICNAVNDNRCINFAGQTSLNELIHLFNIADILISNDSGPPNFASLTDIKGLVFFGPETPVCYKPLGENIEGLYSNYMCSPCVSAYNHRKSACNNNKCLQSISVNEVYLRTKNLINLK